MHKWAVTDERKLTEGAPTRRQKAKRRHNWPKKNTAQRACNHFLDWAKQIKKDSIVM